MHRSFTFLGTGTSQGVPVIGCRCTVCTSTDVRDQRLRTAGLLRLNDKTIAIDAGPDFRQQMLRERVVQLSDILITHAHFDHIAGLEDTRSFYFRQAQHMRLYAQATVLTDLKNRYAYAFEAQPYPGSPRFDLIEIADNQTFYVDDIAIEPLAVQHGSLPILGFKYDDFVYITDCKILDAPTKEKIKGTKNLVINALHHRPHHAHLTFDEALALIDELQPQRAFLTHMSHEIGLHAALLDRLPPHVSPAYDGLTIEI